MYYTKYEPKTPDELLGQVQRNSANLLITTRPPIKMVMLTGPTGVGKTTIGKMYAASLGVNPKIINCRTKGVADIRVMLERYMVRELRSEYTFVFLDEVDALSAEAQQSLLGIENYPDHLILVATTKDPHKLRKDFLHRFHRLDLPSPSKTDIGSLIKRVISEEGLELDDGQKKMLWERIPQRELSVRYCLDLLYQIANNVLEGVDPEDDRNSFFELVRGVLNGVAISSLPVLDNSGRLTGVCMAIVNSAVKSGDLYAVREFGRGLGNQIPEEVAAFYQLVASYYLERSNERN